MDKLEVAIEYGTRIRIKSVIRIVNLETHYNQNQNETGAKIENSTGVEIKYRVGIRTKIVTGTGIRIDGMIMAALHHSWTSATSGLRGLFLITCRQNFLRGLFLITCRQTFFVCKAPSGARPSAVANVADA
ncbi:hypothetical protein EVAR_93164_1 [Eumeta japonica]|uniref:Uncharacterized protein n=1 Tax=Eumeta variegata TaxID=151549 RepID=A0A4C1TFD8_EUMVA|nr:hypothetical protein EVAR_93164_1 [Eumeta japonica]